MTVTGRHTLTTSLALLAAFTATINVLAQDNYTPTEFMYQGRLIDGTTLVNGQKTMAFRIYDAAESNEWGEGTWPLYAQTTVVDVVDGLFAVPIGGNTANMDMMGFEYPLECLRDPMMAGGMGTSFWLEVEMDGVVLGPREQLQAAPFALVARSMPDDSLTGTELKSDSLTSRHFRDGEINTDHIKDNTIRFHDIWFNYATNGQVMKYINGAWEAADDLTSSLGGGGNAETLDSLDSAQFLRSDANDTYIAGTLAISATSTLDVDGALHAEDLHVGENSGGDDDHLRFDAGGEHLKWDNSGDTFSFSNDLEIEGDVEASGGVTVGDTASPAAGTIRWTGQDFEGYTGEKWVSLTALRGNGTVEYHQKIDTTSGGFTGTIDNFDHFGTSVASLGDLDGDGTADLAVGEPFDAGAGNGRGAVWVLFLHPNGTVKTHVKITDVQTWFSGTLANDDYFGHSVASLGDLDGDGVTDLAVGARGDDDGGSNRGAVWVLFLNANGTVKGYQKISDTQGGFAGVLDDSEYFGWSLASLGSLDGDGIPELAVGVREDDEGGLDRGAVWVLFLNADGTVKSHQKISDIQGGFSGTLDNHDYFGQSVAPLGDLDGDGVPDLAVGAFGDDDAMVGSGTDRGAVWMLFLNASGTVKSDSKISATQGGLTGALYGNDYFGHSLASIGDLDGDGVSDLAVGAPGSADSGAVWALFLNADGTVKADRKIDDTQSGFSGAVDSGDYFGSAIAAMGDMDGDGLTELAVGASRAEGGGSFRGAVFVLFMGN